MKPIIFLSGSLVIGGVAVAAVFLADSRPPFAPQELRSGRQQAADSRGLAINNQSSPLPLQDVLSQSTTQPGPITPPAKNPTYTTVLELKHQVDIPCATKIEIITNADGSTSTRTVKDCSRPAAGWETYSWGGTIGLENLKIPYVKNVGDFLEGPYYDQQTLDRLIAQGKQDIDKHGPIDKLLTWEYQNLLRRQYIRAVNAGKLIDPEINAPNPPDELSADATTEQKRQFQQEFNQYLKTYFPQDAWLKVPMAARGNMTVTGQLSATSVSNSGGDGNDAGTLQPGNIILAIPQLVRTQQIAHVLWRVLLPQAAQSQYVPNQEELQLSSQADPDLIGAEKDREDITRAGTNPQVQFSESISRGGPHTFIKNISIRFSFPAAQNLWQYAAGPAGFLTGIFKPWPLFDEEEATGPGTYTFTQTAGAGNSQLSASIRSQGLKKGERVAPPYFLYPYLEGVNKAARFAQDSARPLGQ
ncbi:hypothetical protein HY388_01520 [Candidatus Daviesbacteria bacterium]|nr:hypothetical protein [Candidatus Daviesbacteria bacterium]